MPRRLSSEINHPQLIDKYSSPTGHSWVCVSWCISCKHPKGAAMLYEGVTIIEVLNHLYTVTQEDV